MRVGYVTQWYSPEPAAVPVGIAEGLARRGHQVDVVTGIPNYPTGHVYPGYRIRPYQREGTVARVTVHRAALYPSHDQRAAHRVANYTSFAASAALVTRAKVPSPDIWLIYSSPATACIPAIRLLKRNRRPVFLMIQDLWPDSVLDSSLAAGRFRQLAGDALTRFCDFSYRYAAGVGVISPGMAEVLAARGIPRDKIHYTPNWTADPRAAAAERGPSATLSASRAELGLPDGRLWVYAGNFGDLQCLDPLIDAFARRPQASLVLVGDGIMRDRLRAQADQLDAGNVHIRPRVSQADAQRLLESADVQVVSLADVPLLRTTMPSKMQTSLALGTPVLVHGAGDVAQLVTGAGAGWVASPHDIASLLAAIDHGLAAPQERLDAMGAAARDVYEREFTPEVGIAALEQALTACLGT